MSEPVKTEPTDAEISAKTGFGEPEGEETEETTASEEDTEESKDSEDSADDSEESEEGEDDKSSSRHGRKSADSDDDSEEKSDTSDDSSSEDEEDEDEDESDDESSETSKRTVPYSKLKATRQKVADLTRDLAEARKKLSDATKSESTDDIEDATADVEEAAKKLGEELGVDKDAVAKIIKASVDIVSKKSKLPQDVLDKLKVLDDLQKQNLESKEAAHFQKEWSALDIKKQYPNATKSALKEAEKLMDELAHSKEHHKHDLDYILFKNKKKFETVLMMSPKSKSGENAKRIRTDNDESSQGEDEELVDIENLTPELMKRRDLEDREMRASDIGYKDYTIRTPKRD